MKIGLSGQHLLRENPAGPEKYTYNLYHSLSQIDHENQYVIYFEDIPSQDYFSQLTSSNPNFSFKILNKELSWTQNSLSAELYKYPIDLFFSPIHTLPIRRPKNIKYVVMIHGLEYKSNKKTSVRLLNRMLEGYPEQYSCRSADKIIVPSEATKLAIISKHWANEDKIVVIPEGVGNEFKKSSEEEINRVRQTYHLANSNYLIFVGTIQPRKNLVKTIEAFAEAVKSAPSFKDSKLLIVGKKGWDYEEILETPKKFGISEQVIFAGRVPDKDLPPLLSGACALINFSVEEGFGLPLLEAMACEIPCLISDIPPFKEVCSEYAYYANPKEESEMYGGVIKALNHKLKVDLVNAKDRAKLFSWEETAKKTLSVFQNLVKNI